MSNTQALSAHELNDARGLLTEEFVAACHSVMIPVNEHAAYFCIDSLDERERQRLVFDPLAALPPRVADFVPHLCLVLVPYLSAETGMGGNDAAVRIGAIRPARDKQLLCDYRTTENAHYIFLAIRHDDYYDIHIVFYQLLAEQIIESAGAQIADPFNALLDKELKSNAHGEINEPAWLRKKDLLSLAADANDRQNYLDRYRLAALEDTLTLYLHGLCCDIDLDSGPKQIASKHARQRLQLLRDILPPPAGVALFPDELGKTA